MMQPNAWSGAVLWRAARALALCLALSMANASPAPLAAAEGERYAVTAHEVDDLKSVFATVQSADQVEARARISGMVASLSVDEGSAVTPGETIAVVADQKLALRMQGLDARIKGLEAQLANARTDLGRAERLLERGIVSTARVDELRTAHDVASNQLRTARAERSVVEKQVEEGAVLAPAEGRVLKVAVKTGSFVTLGDTIAVIAAEKYILRLALPERHAASLKLGDPVIVGARGLGAGQRAVGTGRIVQIYPELRNGRVIADAEVAELGDYFVGERVLVWISVGKRSTIVIPGAYAFNRYGIDFVRVARDEGPPADVVVQLGQPVRLEGLTDPVEVLSGLAPGDVLVKP